MKINSLLMAFRLYPDSSSKLVLLRDWLFNRRRFHSRMALDRRFLAGNFMAGR